MYAAVVTGACLATCTDRYHSGAPVQVFTGLRRLEELVVAINDVIENRIEKNLKIISKTLLVDLPIDKSFTLEDFVRCQQDHINTQAVLLQVCMFYFAFQFIFYELPRMLDCYFKL